LKFILPAFLLISTALAAQQKPAKEQNGRASYYHDKFQGRKTSSGEPYEKHDFTAAHRTYPFNTLVLVTNKLNQRSVVVRINDRGPFHKSRMIDLSRSAAMKAGMIPFGVVPVKITPLQLLNELPLTDSSLHDGEVWNCNASLTTLSNVSLLLWETENWQHAFYMASDLELDHQDHKFVIRVSGNNNQRRYQLLETNVENKEVAVRRLKNLKENGFIDAVLLP
jgi:rare lipoprotein A